jgi:hypothetical protein
MFEIALKLARSIKQYSMASDTHTNRWSVVMRGGAIYVLVAVVHSTANPRGYPETSD